MSELKKTVGLAFLTLIVCSSANMVLRVSSPEVDALYKYAITTQKASSTAYATGLYTAP